MSMPYYNPTTTARPVPLRERFNLRIVTFVAVFALLLGLPFYLYMDAAVTGGLKDRGDHFDVDLKAMSTFPFDQENGRLEDVPKRWRDLDGKTVVMQGEIAPGSDQATGVGARFDLVYSVAKCCFSGSPQIQHFVKVTVPPDAAANVSGSGAIQVKGVLRVEVTKDPETQKISGIYHVTAKNIESL